MSNKAASPLDAIKVHLRNHPGLDLLLGSHNDEKPVHYEIIANDISKNYGIPLGIIPIKHLFLHPSPIEDGLSTEDNADIKAKSLKEARVTIRTPRTKANRALKHYSRSKGIPYYPRNVILYSEDCVGGVPTKIWPHFVELLIEHGVNPELLKDTRTLAHNNVEFTLPIHYGKMVESIGAHLYHDLTRQAAQRAGYGEHEPIPLIDRVSCQWNRLDDALDKKRDSITEIIQLFLHVPKGLSHPLTKTSHRLPVSKDFQHSADKPNQAIGAGFLPYMRDDSFRRKVFEQLLIKAADTPLAEFRPRQRIKAAARALTAREQRKLLVAQVTPADFVCKGLNIKNHTPSNLEEMSSLLAMEFSSDSSEPRTASVLIVPPYRPETLKERLEFVFIVSGMNIARQIDPRYGLKASSMILLNYKGCHDWYLDFLHHSSEAGYLGNHHDDLTMIGNVPASIIKSTKVTLRSDRYFHTLYSDDAAALCDVGRQLARYSLQHIKLSPHRPAEDYFYKQNRQKPDGMPVITAFMAANHELIFNAQHATDIGEIAAELDAALWWGGMSKKPGKALKDAYLRKGGQHLAASTTNDLILLETDQGLTSDIHERIIRRTIAKRQMDLIENGDVFLSGRGGAGTISEDAMALIYGKPIIFYDPSLKHLSQDPWSQSVKAAEMRCLFGEKIALQLLRSNDVFIGEGFAFATSQEQAKEMVQYIIANPQLGVRKIPRLRPGSLDN